MSIEYALQNLTGRSRSSGYFSYTLFKILKRLLHPKMKMLSLITYPHVVPNPYKLCSSSGHYFRYFGWKPGGLWLYSRCTADGRWTILTIPFTLFWSSTVLFTWQPIGTVTSLPVFIQTILNCVLKTNEASTGLERIHNSYFSHRLLWEPILPIRRIRTPNPETPGAPLHLKMFSFNFGQRFWKHEW